MVIFKNLFFSFVLSNVLYYPISATEAMSPLIPDSFENIKWYSVAYEDSNRSFIAKLPGNPEEIIKNEQLCFFHSTHREVHYGIYFNPTILFEPPATVEEFIDRYKHLENSQIIALKPKQPHLLYLLQINMMNSDGIRAVFRVYATETTLYYAMVDGHDLTFAGDFFQSIKIEK